MHNYEGLFMILIVVTVHQVYAFGEENAMRISDVQKRLGISKRNIHFYITEGLLSPKHSDNKYYDFSEEDVEKLKMILEMRNLGMSISSIRSLFLYPMTINYEIYETIRRLKKEITERQVQIESLMALADKIPPNAEAGMISRHYPEIIRSTPSRFDVDALYPLNPAYMTTTFLFAPYTNGESAFYHRYVWNRISEELQSALGSCLDVMNEMLDHLNIEELNRVSEESALIVFHTVNTNSEEERYGLLRTEVIRFLEDPQLIDKWRLYDRPLLSRLSRFYREQYSLFEVYNRMFADYQNRIHTAAQQLMKQEEELISSLQKALGRTVIVDDLVQVYTFRSKFFNLFTAEEIAEMLRKHSCIQ